MASRHLAAVRSSRVSKVRLRILGLVIAGVALVELTGGDVRALGASFLTLGLLGLVTAAGGLLAERMVEQRITTRWPECQGGNGSGPDRDYAAGP